jgi:flagellin-like protein
MTKRIDRRGLSPVVASVMMILLVLVLAALIFLWARGFVSEQVEKFGKPIEQLCGSVDFEVQRTNDFLEVVNRGDVNIRYLDIKMTRGGDSKIEKFDFQIDAGESIREQAFLLMDDNKDPEKIVAYPALIGNVKGGSSNKVFTCLDTGKTIL